MILEQHFLGFDPRQSFDCIPSCPLYQEPVTGIWFETWFFTGWQVAWIIDTGIVYQKAYACFDIVGCFLGINLCPGISGVGFTGNETNTFGAKPRDHDQWLLTARQSTNSDALPEPGTIFACAGMTRAVGYASGG